MKLVVLTTPNDCPFRGNNRNGGVCNLADSIKCESYDDNYPNSCPLLDETIQVQRGQPKSEADDETS